MPASNPIKGWQVTKLSQFKGHTMSQIIPPSYWEEGRVGADLTTIKVGGPVRFVARIESAAQLAESLYVAKSLDLPWKVVGGGSNLLISDQGFAGVMIVWKPSPAHILTSRLDQQEWAQGVGELTASPQIEAWRTEQRGGGYLQLVDHTGGLETDQYQLVELPAGMPWGQAVSWCLNQQLAGLHLFARIPCQVGGALYNNIHGGSTHLSAFVVGARVWDCLKGQSGRLLFNQLALGYDTSIFQTNPGRYIIQSVVLRLPQFSPTVVKNFQSQYLQWVKEKAQAQPSGPNAGSVFQNLTSIQVEQMHYTPEAKQAGVAEPEAGMRSAGRYIDLAGLKGSGVGGMQVSELHANFIVNLGQGTQADFIGLVNRIRKVVKQYFQIDLKPEVELIDAHGKPHLWS